MKKVLVTGGAGFIGSNFIHTLLEMHDDVIVHNMDCLTYAGNLANLTSVENNPRYHFHKINITDFNAVNNFFNTHDIDTVFHLAAESHVDRSIHGGRDFVMTNVVGTQTLLEVAKNYDLERFVHVSTDEVYGSLGETGAFTEESPIQPSSPYSASKAGSDLLALSYYETHKVPVLVTRCSNNYGSYQFPEKLIPLMVTNAVEGKDLPIYGSGLNIRDWIHVKDHNKGVLAIHKHGKLGEVYNLGGQAERTNIDIVKGILSIMGKSEDSIIYVEDRKGHDFRYAMDFSRLTDLCGWKPQYTFEQGLEETVNWYLNNDEWWKQIKTGEYLNFYKKQYGSVAS